MPVGTLNREALGLVPWLVASWLLSIAAACLLWLGPAWGKRLTRAVRFLEGQGGLLSPGEVLALLYALGLPYAAILAGMLSPDVMGFAGFSWWLTLGRGALLAAGFLLLAGLAWQAYLRTGTPPAGLLSRQRRLVATPAGRPLLLLWAAAEQSHWAFYRALPLLVWGPRAGLWLGLLLVLVERYALPRTSGRLRQPGGLEEEAWWLARAVALTAAFAVLRNLWICIILQALLEGIVAWLVQRRMAGREERAEGVPDRGRPALPVALSALGFALLLLLLFTWGAVSPRLSIPAPESLVSQPTPLLIPTPTPTAAPYPTPRAAPTATPAPSPAIMATPARTYVLQEGDTLNAIALMFDVSVAELMQANGITDPAQLQVGQVLVIP